MSTLIHTYIHTYIHHTGVSAYRVGMTGVSAVDQNMEIAALPVPVLYCGVPVEASGAALI